MISGNTNDGVDIEAGSFGNLVQNDYIGVDTSGELALGNGGYGVYVDAADGNQIDPSHLAAHNVISANSAGGIYITDNATGNQVFGNLIGTDALGEETTDAHGNLLGNSGDGVIIGNASGNTIGGTGVLQP